MITAHGPRSDVPLGARAAGGDRYVRTPTAAIDIVIASADLCNYYDR